MDLSRIRPTTVSLALAAGVMLLVGSYTGNSGFQVAGLITATVAVIGAFNQARSPDGKDRDGNG